MFVPFSVPSTADILRIYLAQHTRYIAQDRHTSIATVSAYRSAYAYVRGYGWTKSLHC